MKAYAKQFYEGQTWKDCRESYLTSVHYICERCSGIAKIVHHIIYITPSNISNPFIALSFDNLEALCQDCHNKEHHKNKSKLILRYSFDSEGNLIIPPTKISAVKGLHTDGKL